MRNHDRRPHHIGPLSINVGEWGGVGLIDVDVFVQLAGCYNAVQAGLEP